MKKLNLFYSLIAGLVFVLTPGCKEETDGNLISSLSESSSSSSGTGCRGRNSGIKDGPQNLLLPYPNTGYNTYSVSQTWFGSYSHYSAGGEHAIDFPMPEGRPIWPVARGRVMAVKEDSNTTCSSSCSDANYVLIDHGNGYYAKYLHFCQNCVDVAVGDNLTSSQTQIGTAGNTGWSTGSHLHFELVDWEENCTVTYGFTNINGGARTALSVGSSYTSANSGGSAIVASTISGNVYKNVGIEITTGIPWYQTSSGSVNIQGNLTTTAVSDGYNQVAVFLLDKSMNLVGSISYFTTTGSFNVNYPIPAVTQNETYYLAVSKSKSENNSYWWDNPPIMVFY